MTYRLFVVLAAAVAFSLLVARPSDAQAPARSPSGKRLFLRCAACHEIMPSGVARIGPRLQGIFGRHVASLPDFAYSPALKAADFVWDATMLDRWLESPGSLVPGTAMAFAGLPDPAERQALIAYLRNPGP